MTLSHLLPITILLLFYSPSSSASPISDPAILLRVKNNQILDPSNRLSNWLILHNDHSNSTNNHSHCHWTGITCNPLSSVIAVNLDKLNLSGPFPSGFCRIPTLRNFSISDNSFNNITSLSLSHCSHLHSLNLSNNDFSGNLPDFSPEFTSLFSLDFSSNDFSGKIPRSFRYLSSVKILRLFGNYLTGPAFPEFITNLTQITHYELSYNLFDSSEIPTTIAKLSKLEVVWLTESNLTGKIPESLCTLQTLKSFDVATNSLSGEIPQCIGNLTKLWQLELFDNKFSGELPENLGNLKNLYIFDASQNNLTGTGEDSGNFRENKNLYQLKLFNNSFAGELPANLGSNSILNEFDVSTNYFSGEFPTTLCSGKQLWQIITFNNRFSSKFPEIYGNCSSLSYVRIQNSNFSGEFPQNFWNLPHLDTADLQDNHFEGTLPPTISNSFNLSNLLISGNMFSGNLPSEICGLKKLIELSLGENRFSGELPSCITELKGLQKIELQGNMLSGEFPMNVRSWVQLTDLNVQTDGEFKKRRPFKMVSFQRGGFSEQEIFSRLTEENVIGSGGSGRVYRVTLNSGRNIAVKKLWSGEDKNKDMGLLFKSEVEALGSVRHVNIVKLLFSYIGEGFRALGYEYMENGSLGDVLHGEKGGEILDWSRRFAIALGAAQGLAYLHHDCVPAIIHRDVKSNNILLDDKFLPRVADFGLAKPDLLAILSINSLIYCTKYGYTLKVTEKSDVYSFGVVLIELVTGKRPNDASFGENMDIVKWMTEVVLQSHEFDQAKQLIDPRMNPDTEIHVTINK
ncbi:LRR receptor-like serine/threonine-protein kinase HSL2 [Chenopodium quinoa]|uniref:LRR receptor-like serine/threonine-protein kinase HSL2 n=1 Tax=Chenopodium quinoa TaxID=63459 RepID=UPI000B79440A|nr:LRR receptor-like serine/threonine-protein kinase HSL2 [Chenopodium quinoa]